jgi:ABC-type lipopolysaccharide export system ATPase subunit
MKAEHIQYNEQKKEINKHIMKTEEFVKDFKIENISKSNAFTLS